MIDQQPSLPKYIRILVPLVLILVWFTAAGIGGPYFGKISEVASNDQSTFLPASAESTKVTEEMAKFQDESSIPAILVFENNGTDLTDENIADIKSITEPMGHINGATDKASPPILSDDKKAAIVVLNMNSSAEYKDFVKEINSQLAESNLTVNYYVSGPVGFLSDLGKAFGGIDGLLLAVALGAVFIVLVIVYRSPLLPFIVLMTSVFALCAAILTVFYLAKADVLTLNSQVQGILFILVIGAATDYALLFISRYKEELHQRKEVYKAILASWKRSFEPIVAAGGTVILGLLCLLLSDLTSNKALGPVGAIGIFISIISALTLLPSLLMVFGRKAFWPLLPRYHEERKEEDDQTKPLWGWVGRLVKKHYRVLWISVSLILLVSSLGLMQLKADGVPQSEFLLGESVARNGQKIIDEHFPGGSGTPAYIIAPEAKLDEALAILEADSGVDSVNAKSNDSPSGMLPLGKAAEEIKASIAEQIPETVPGRDNIIEQAYPFKDATAVVVDDELLLEATLQDTADSDAAQATIERLREKLSALDSSIQVGGTAAVQLDTRISSQHDRAVVIPAVLIVITIILMLLLRSIAAPIMLLLTTIVSFTATLGLSALVFNHIFGWPGADPSVVLYCFIFLVALGIDYNIFLMTRVREESAKSGTRTGTIKALIVTGGVITSAGIVLAVTFAALAVIPILFLAQLAFIVGVGVLVDTLIVRSLLVPSLSYDLGRFTWWPSRLSRKKTTK